MKTLIPILISILVLILSAAIVQADPLTVHPDNPRYFTDGSGKAIYVTGSHNWDVLIDKNDGLPEIEYIKFLDYMVDNNQNFLRLWTAGRVWQHPDGRNEYITPTIYQRTGPDTATDGRLKFDLTKYNPIVMDPYLYHESWVLDPDIVPAMSYTRIYGVKMNLADMTPSDNVEDCSTTYCLKNPGQEYLIYQPYHHSFNINLVAGDYNYEWFDPKSGTITQTGTITADGGKHAFSIPSSIASEAVLYLKRR